jgi:mevalonate pyrophosphate decarboxylase
MMKNTSITLRFILEDMGERKGVPTTIKCGNQSSMKLTNNPIYHERSKHVEIQHHFLGEMIQSKEIDLVYSNTNKNMSHILTKPLEKPKFLICRDMLDIIDNSFLH